MCHKYFSVRSKESNKVDKMIEKEDIQWVEVMISACRCGPQKVSLVKNYDVQGLEK